MDYGCLRQRQKLRFSIFEAVSKVTDTASFGIILHVSLKGHIFRQLS